MTFDLKGQFNGSWSLACGIGSKSNVPCRSSKYFCSSAVKDDPLESEGVLFSIATERGYSLFEQDGIF